MTVDQEPISVEKVDSLLRRHAEMPELIHRQISEQVAADLTRLRDQINRTIVLADARRMSRRTFSKAMNEAERQSRAILMHATSGLWRDPDPELLAELRLLAELANKVLTRLPRPTGGDSAAKEACVILFHMYKNINYRETVAISSGADFIREALQLIGNKHMRGMSATAIKTLLARAKPNGPDRPFPGQYGSGTQR